LVFGGHQILLDSSGHHADVDTLGLAGQSASSFTFYASA
jgi:hypothetical protein